MYLGARRHYAVFNEEKLTYHYEKAIFSLLFAQDDTKFAVLAITGVRSKAIPKSLSPLNSE